MPSYLRTWAYASAVLASLLWTVAAEPKVVHFPIAKSTRRASPAALEKRGHILSTLTNEEIQSPDDGLFYYINITIGTPPQNFGVQLDTGSSDLWVISAIDTYDCTNYYGDLGCDFGLYNQNKSSTYALLQSGGFSITYADETSISGDFVTDNVGFGGDVIVKKQIFGLANSTTGDTYGLMGVGFDTNEANTTYSGTTYPSIIDELKTQGFINVKAFSLWLDDLSSSSGSILFGGVDRSKYHGDLIGLPIQPDVYTDNITSFTVSLTSIDFVDSSAKDNLYSGAALPALLDSGTALTYLPDAVALSIINGIGVAQDNNTGYNLVPCSLNQTAANLTFSFGGSGGPSIMVPLSEFVSDPYLLSDGSVLVVDGEDTCIFGIMAGGDNTSTILGDTFLRSAYVVYDIENQLIGMANTNFHPAGQPDIVEYKKGQLGIPGVSSTATQAVPTSVYAAAETGPTITGFPSGTFHLSTPAGPQATGLTRNADSGAASRSVFAGDGGLLLVAGLGIAMAGLAFAL